MLTIDKKLWNYIEEHTSQTDELLYELYRETNVKVMNPRMLSGPYQGKFLEMISCLMNPVHVLEIGTYTGYSAICLAKGLSRDGKVHTIEKNDEVIGYAKKYFEKAGLSEKISIYIGEAGKIIPGLQYTYDLVYIDGEKEEYIDYYNLLFPKVRKGGIILADNVLWNGKVVDKKSTDIETEAIERFNNYIQQDGRAENFLLPIRDGLMMIRKVTD